MKLKKRNKKVSFIKRTSPFLFGQALAYGLSCLFINMYIFYLFNKPVGLADFVSSNNSRIHSAPIFIILAFFLFNVVFLGSIIDIIKVNIGKDCHKNDSKLSKVKMFNFKRVDMQMMVIFFLLHIIASVVLVGISYYISENYADPIDAKFNYEIFYLFVTGVPSLYLLYRIYLSIHSIPYLSLIMPQYDPTIYGKRGFCKESRNKEIAALKKEIKHYETSVKSNKQKKKVLPNDKIATLILNNLYCIISINGHASTQQLNYFKNLADRYRVSKYEITEIINYAHNNGYKIFMPQKIDNRLKVYSIMEKAALRDGNICSEERALLDDVKARYLS